LRYRIADFINDRLKFAPGLHAGAKAAIASWMRTALPAKQSDGAKQLISATAGKQSHDPEQVTPATAEGQIGKLEKAGTVAAAEPEARGRQISLDDLPLPPLEMRELVGPTDIAAFDNPTRKPVYEYLDASLYDRVFDFGCGCGRVARQLILQQPSPKLYLGVDLHAGMIRWCQQNLQPAAPHFSFLHHDVFNTRFNPKPGAPSVAAFPAANSQFTLVNALSVFTHLTEEQAVHYLRECARILRPEGVLHASWFLFDKREFPMMRPETAALYVSYVDPSAAVIFDRDWVRTTARQAGLRICGIVAPHIRGHQWVLMMTKRQDAPEPEFPPDTAPYGNAAAPTGARFDLSQIGLEE